MEPASDADQSCRSFCLSITPTTEVSRYQDGFGNRVHHFNIFSKHTEVRILAAGVVKTHPRVKAPALCLAAYPLEADALGLEVLDFLQFRGPVRSTPRLVPVVDELRPRAGMPLGDLVLHVSRHIHERFEYARYVTLSSSPVDDVLEQGKGVCQDFTHLMIAILRSLGVPARYVSGYIHRPNQESQSHAWCEVWCRAWTGLALIRPTTAWSATILSRSRWVAISRMCRRTKASIAAGYRSRSRCAWKRGNCHRCRPCRGKNNCRR